MLVSLVAGAGASAQSPDWAALLRDHGRLPKRERLVVLDASGRELARVDGTERAVPVPANIAEMLATRALGATLLHNHPEMTSFSGADLDLLAQVGVRRVIAVTADGTTFEATAGPHFGDGWAAAMRQDLPARLASRVQTEAWRRGLPPEVLVPHEPHVAALILGRLGVITYRVSPSLTARLAFDRYREVFARLIDVETAAAVAAPQASGR
jgi:hypothetical protein